MGTFKNWLVVIFVLLLLGGWVTAFVMLRRAQNDEAQNKNNAAVINAATKVVKNTIDTFKRSHSVHEIQAPLTDKQKQTEQLPGWADTVAKGLELGAGYKAKLQEQTQVNFTLKDSLLRANHKLDSLKRDVFFYKNKYLQLQYTKGNPADTSDKGSFAYTYNAGLVITQFQKRNWLLGAMHSYIDVSSLDSNMRINDVKHYQYMQKEPVFGLRLQGLGSYNFRSKLFQPGFGARFDVGRFSLLGGFYFNTTNSQFNPVVNGAYDFVRF